MIATFDFTGKKAIITGAAGCYASWLAKAFNDANADLWLVDMDGDELAKLASSLNGKGEVNTSIMDLTVEENIVRLQNEIGEKWEIRGV